MLVSDGVVEAHNEARELWGFERLEVSLHDTGALEPTALLERLLGDLRAFTGGTSQHDDMTLVAVRVCGAYGA